MIRIEPDRSVVGPLVFPGRSPCIRCQTQRPRSAGPSLAATAGTACRLSARADPVLLARAAASGAAQVRAWAAGHPVDSCGTSPKLGSPNIGCWAGPGCRGGLWLPPAADLRPAGCRWRSPAPPPASGLPDRADWAGILSTKIGKCCPRGPLGGVKPLSLPLGAAARASVGAGNGCSALRPLRSTLHFATPPPSSSSRCSVNSKAVSDEVRAGAQPFRGHAA